MNIQNNAPSLFDDGHIGIGMAPAAIETKIASTANLVDLMHDGFYIVFLLKNQYVPSNADSFRDKILTLLHRFESQARKLQFSNEDIQDAKYAYCSLLDETIVTQQNARFFDLQNNWMMCPLQLSLFGSQLAGYRFFEKMDEIRSKGKERLAALEAYHYCMLLGFHGKYRLESIESLNLLASRVGDEIDYLKGKKASFSPFAALPDQIKHIIHRELPFFWILIFWLVFAFSSFASLHFMLSSQGNQSFAKFQNVITAPAEPAYIIIHLP
ncbi:DotU family type IV/VI secretion system protein [Acinetobacter bouvetii]|uniref:DotU family type IV/VI secretion system protein n=1 Tax=Acinetobacter bouvetii TaxID=202951 RepID=A0A4Q7AXL5_9GAMM|nr:type IVB secretion system protein IcmH/DotU [Acinetobacter bouvetii]RZG66885.1 DotU family type IV/VI secretion system protein [Acinetobacter bouvetii]